LNPIPILDRSPSNSSVLHQRLRCCSNDVDYLIIWTTTLMINCSLSSRQTAKSFIFKNCSVPSISTDDRNSFVFRWIAVCHLDRRQKRFAYIEIRWVNCSVSSWQTTETALFLDELQCVILTDDRNVSLIFRSDAFIAVCHPDRRQKRFPYIQMSKLQCVLLTDDRNISFFFSWMNGCVSSVQTTESFFSSLFVSCELQCVFFYRRRNRLLYVKYRCVSFITSDNRNFSLDHLRCVFFSDNRSFSLFSIFFEVICSQFVILTDDGNVLSSVASHIPSWNTTETFSLDELHFGICNLFRWRKRSSNKFLCATLEQVSPRLWLTLCWVRAIMTWRTTQH